MNVVLILSLIVEVPAENVNLFSKPFFVKGLILGYRNCLTTIPLKRYICGRTIKSITTIF